jgi:hypothetical protein
VPAAELQGVLIPPGRKLAAIFRLGVRGPDGQAAGSCFHVTQYDRRHLVGGSQFVILKDSKNGG